MSNNPLRALSSTGLTADTAAAIDVLKARLIALAVNDVSRANVTASVLSEVIESLRTLGA